MEIGLQLFSARKAFMADRAGTLDKIAGIGYRHIEVPVDFSGQDLFGTGELSAAELKALAAGAGLNVLATHTLMTDDSQLKQVIAYHDKLECGKAVIPIAFFRDGAEALSYADKLNKYGRELKKHGIELIYHNHFHEFQRFDGMSVFDILVSRTDPELVKFELDTYWALRAGMDNTAMLQWLGGRCVLIHQKDLPHGIAPVNLFETIDEREPIGIPAFQRFGGADNFTEIGQGQMDIDRIVRAAKAFANVEYMIVEQDATERDELESVAISYAALRGLLVAHAT